MRPSQEDRGQKPGEVGTPDGFTDRGPRDTPDDHAQEGHGDDAAEEKPSQIPKLCHI